MQRLKAVKCLCQNTSSLMFNMVLNTPLTKCWRKLCISSMWTLLKILYVGISQDIRSSSSNILYQIFVLKNLQNSQWRTCTKVFFQPTTCNFIEKETLVCIFFPWILRIFLGTTLLWKTSCELVLKGGFYKIRRTKEIS